MEVLPRRGFLKYESLLKININLECDNMQMFFFSRTCLADRNIKHTHTRLSIDQCRIVIMVTTEKGRELCCFLLLLFFIVDVVVIISFFLLH